MYNASLYDIDLDENLDYYMSSSSKPTAFKYN